MYAVATMKVAFRENGTEEWQERKILYVFRGDIADMKTVTPYLEGGWIRFLKGIGIQPKDKGAQSPEQFATNCNAKNDDFPTK